MVEFEFPYRIIINVNLKHFVEGKECNHLLIDTKTKSV